MTRSRNPSTAKRPIRMVVSISGHHNNQDRPNLGLMFEEGPNGEIVPVKIPSANDGDFMA
jgi:hypothetical protein